jgi:hypothetical protein
VHHGRRAALGALFVACAAFVACRSTSAPVPAAIPAPARRCSASTRDAIHRIALAEIERQELVGLSLVIARANGLITSSTSASRIASARGPVGRDALPLGVDLEAAHGDRGAAAGRSGSLDLDRDVRAYVPEFPAQSSTITARQLLCHQGGIVHYTNGPVVASPPRTDRAHPHEDAVDAVATFALSPLVNEPGTQYSYSTHGYVLLGAVVQRAGGEPYEQQVLARIAQAARDEHAAVRQVLDRDPPPHGRLSPRGRRDRALRRTST